MTPEEVIKYLKVNLVITAEHQIDVVEDPVFHYNSLKSFVEFKIRLGDEEITTFRLYDREDDI